MPAYAQGYAGYQINGNRWIVDSQSEYRGRASAVRRASTWFIGALDYLFDGLGTVGIDSEAHASRFDNLGSGVFACNPANRVGIILCGEYSTDDPPVMRSKWVLSSVYLFGHSISGAALETSDSRNVSVSDPFIPGGVLLSHEDQDESSAETTRLCVCDGLWSSISASGLSYNVVHSDVLASMIATRDGRQGPAAISAYTHIFGPSFVGESYGLSWTGGMAPITPSPTWASFVNQYHEENGFPPYSISAITLHLHLSDISSEAAVRKDSAVVFPKYIQTGFGSDDQNAATGAFASASGGCYDAGNFDCLLLDEKPFDYAEKQRISCYSESMFRVKDSVILSQDADFQRPENLALNSENVTGVDPSERLPNGTTKTFLKAGESEFGTFSDEPVCVVALRSYAIHNRFDVQDGAAPYSDGKFRFQGKIIKQTGIEFVPWSSNSFSGTKYSWSPDQDSTPTPAASSSDSYVSYCFKSTQSPQEDDLSGKWYTEASVYDITDAGTPSDLWFERRYPSNNTNQQGGGVVWPQNLFAYSSGSRVRIYSGTRTIMPLFYADVFKPKKDYHPNVSFDEEGWLAASICNDIQAVGRSSESSGYDDPWGRYFGEFASPIGQFDTSVPANRFYARRESAFLTRRLFENGSGYYAIHADTGWTPGWQQHTFMPSLAGKEFLCGKSDVRGKKLSDCLFHCFDSGHSFTKTLVRNFVGKKETVSASVSDANFTSGAAGYRVDQAIVFSEYSGSFSHACTFNTDRVEVYVQWSASLQCPGAYRAGRAMPKMITNQNVEDPPSIISPMLFVKESEYDDATPILVAQVWVRANGTVSVSTTADLPSEFGFEGAQTVGRARVYRVGNSSTFDVVDLSAARLGDQDFFSTEDDTVTPSAVGMRYLGAFPFNRSQTQQLLDGETVTPTHWYMKEEGSDFESQPVCVPWHNDTFGTYKLKFRLVTE